MKRKSVIVSMLFLGLMTGNCYNYSVKAADAQLEKKEINTEAKEAAIQAATLEELSELVPQEMDARVAALNEKYEKIQAEIDTYDKYIENQEKIEDYYSSVYHDMQDTCIRMREYCVKYVQVILESEKENDEKYDDLEDKEAMDSYEAFYDKYCEFMKKYNANPTDIELISAYGDIMTEMVEMSEKFESWKEGDLNAEELKYYLEVNSRVTQKLAELSE